MSDSNGENTPAKEVTPSSPSTAQEKLSPVEGRARSSPVYEPVVTLPEVEVQSLEDNETDMLKLRAKLYRFHMPLEEDEKAEWKERGVGFVKLLEDKYNKKVRVLMRREKTLKICANHFISKDMMLKPAMGSDRAWVWYTPGDFSDGAANPETLCLRFDSVENAKLFQEMFMDVVKGLDLGGKEVEEQLGELNIGEDK